MVEFLESSVLGLRYEEVKNDGLADTPDAEDDIGLPGNVLESDRNTELHDKHGSVGEERAEGHTLGSDLVAEDLDRVEGLERSPTNGVEDLEEVNPSQDGLADWAGDGFSLGLVIKVGNVGNRSGNGDTDPAKSTNKVDNKKHGSAANSIGKASTNSSKNDLYGIHTQGNPSFCLITLDTGSVEESTQVVGDNAVSSPLTEERDETVAGEAVHRSLVSEQSTVVPPSLIATVHLKMLLILVELKLDPLAIGVAVAMKFNKVRCRKFFLSTGV